MLSKSRIFWFPIKEASKSLCLPSRSRRSNLAAFILRCARGMSYQGQILPLGDFAHITGSIHWRNAITETNSTILSNKYMQQLALE